MGKTVKKLHNQGRRHDRLEIDVTPETPKQVYARIYKGISVACPSCNKNVRLAPLASDAPHFRCPSCGCELTEAAYDARNREVKAELDDARAVIAAHEELAARLEGAGAIRRMLLRLRLAFENRRYEDAKAKRSACYSLAGRLAAGRYYVSSWFYATGARRTAEAGRAADEAYRLRLCYEDNAFKVLPAGGQAEARGLVGEWKVFEALRARTLDSSSSLYGARLAANLFLPVAKRSLPRRSGTPAPLWRQVDLVLLTEVGAFVFEVKSKRTKVVVDKDYASIELEGPKGGRRSASWMLDQCATHADSLEEAVDGLTLDDIYEVTVFVNPLAFESPTSGFNRGNVCVGTLECDGVASFVESIENKVTELRAAGVSVMSPERVDELAREVPLRYGDLGRGKMRRHIERLRAIHEGDLGDGGRQVFTSGSLCR